jgi:hypothetical protein
LKVLRIPRWWPESIATQHRVLFQAWDTEQLPWSHAHKTLLCLYNCVLKLIWILHWYSMTGRL